MRAPTTLALLLAAALAGCVQTQVAREPCPFVPSHPCDDRITQEEAMRIARENGLGPGVAPWTAEFGWRVDAAHERGGFHVWTVHNTTVAGGGATRTMGTAAIVDADTGAFVGMLAWTG